MTGRRRVTLVAHSAVAGLFIIQGTSTSASPGFGIRQVPGAASLMDGSGAFGFKRIETAVLPIAQAESVAKIGARWGRVTSMFRSAQHNRRVGGVYNSYHLSGRAIDIARRAGVRHNDVAAAYRAAGYLLVESLDEGDHSHFAFANSGLFLAQPGGVPFNRK